VCQDGNCVIPIITPCLNDTGCIPPNICNNGVCTLPECTLHTECGTATKMCESNRCIDIEPCATDSQCSPGRFCRNGACTRACINDAVCPRGSVCRGGICLQMCESTSSCPTGHECTDGVCVLAACSATKPCPPHPLNPNFPVFRCNAGVCEPLCSSKSDCTAAGAEYDCREGYCYEQICPRFHTAMGGIWRCDPTFTNLQQHAPTSDIDRDKFLLFEGVVTDNNACLDLCEKSRDCGFAFTGKAPTGESTCTLWSRGVDRSTAQTQDPDSQTYSRNF
jgi:hypothetical protein